MNPQVLALMRSIGNGGNMVNRLLAHNMDPGVLRPWVSRKDGMSYISVMKAGNLVNLPFMGNATLRKDEWIELDKQLLEVKHDRLVGVQDLLDRNLTVPLQDGLGTTVFQYEDVSDISGATKSMDAITKGRNDVPEVDLLSLPMYITHKDWGFTARNLAVSRKQTGGLDVVMGRKSIGKIAEDMEDALFSNTTYTWGGGTVYSYINHPSINSVSLSEQWSASATTGGDVLDDILAMKQANITAGFRTGPYGVYIPTGYETPIDADFKAATDGTIRQRIMEVEKIAFVKTADRLPANTVVMVQLTPDVVRMVEGMPLQNVQWESQGGMQLDFKAMTIMVPQIRATQEGDSGVVVLS